MAQGSLEQKGGKVGFEGIGADIKPLLKQFEQLRKQVSDPKIQKQIHRAVGKIYKDEMLNNISTPAKLFGSVEVAKVALI